MQLRSASDIDVSNKKVILRVALDVHFKDDNGKPVIEDDTRLRAIIPTVQDLVKRGAVIMLLSWLQRPEGKPVPGMSMKPVAERLTELLGEKVTFVEDCIGDTVKNAVDEAAAGTVFMLENVRFHPGEKDTKTYDETYAKALAEHADLFINDAFAQTHRDVPSITGIPKYIPSYAGPRLIKEVTELTSVLENPPRPFVAIIGGAKISTKLGVIKALLDKVDNLLLGGALANTILRAQGMQVGTSLIEESMIEDAKALALTDTRLHIPVDVLTAHDVEETSDTYTRAVGALKEDEKILDIGPDTVRLYHEVIHQAKTIVWNGPMGWFELPQFAHGTNEVAKFMAEADAKTIIGGGETIASVQQQGLAEKMSFVSMGGGAMLKLLETGTLAGLKPLIKE